MSRVALVATRQSRRERQKVRWPRRPASRITRGRREHRAYVHRQKEAAGTILPLQRTHTGLMADCGTVSGGGGREWGCLPARHASLGRLQREGRGDNTAGQRARGRVAVCSSPPRLWSHRQGQGSRVGASPQRVPGSKRKRDETACCRLHIVDVREEHRLRGQSHGTAVQ